VEGLVEWLVEGLVEGLVEWLVEGLVEGLMVGLGQVQKPGAGHVAGVYCGVSRADAVSFAVSSFRALKLRSV